jgi:hypothetical protein
MFQSKWAAIVYGRTYEVDFRLMAMPEDFTEEDKQWVLQYILGTTRLPEKLPGQPRWSLFKNDRYCVVGVTCMVRELMSNPIEKKSEDMTQDIKSIDNPVDEKSEDTTQDIESIANSIDEKPKDITKDIKNRPLYVFAGYVTKLTQELPVISPSLNLELFNNPYQYVASKWFVKPYDRDKETIEKTKYEVELEQSEIAINTDNLKLNCNDREIKLWSNSASKALWLKAARYSCPISLCIGLAGEREAIDSPFLNGTTRDVVEPKVLERDEWKEVEEVLSLDTSTRAQKDLNSKKAARKKTLQPKKLSKETQHRSKANRSASNIQERASDQYQRSNVSEQRENNFLERVGEKVVENVENVVNVVTDFLTSPPLNQADNDNANEKKQSYEERRQKRDNQNFSNQDREVEDFGFKPKQSKDDSQKSQTKRSQSSESSQDNNSQDWF